MKNVANIVVEETAQRYPVLKKYHRVPAGDKTGLTLVVMFTAARTGVVVATSAEDTRPCGYSASNWSEEDFIALTGSENVTLSNG